MFVIYRNNKRFNNKLFDTYEAARTYVRKWIRKNLGYADYFDSKDIVNRNPSFKHDGFSVRKQA